MSGRHQRDTLPHPESHAEGAGPAQDQRVNLDRLPDVRDGLTRVERVVLHQLHLLQQERNGRNVPTAMLYGRVVEHVNISVGELQRTLQRLMGISGR